MMPVTALLAQPLPLPGLPVAPATLDFIALLQGGPPAAPAPLPETVEDTPLPVTVSLADLELPDLEPEAERAEQPAPPLPAPPPILAMLQPPTPPVAVVDRAVSMPKGETAPIAVAQSLPAPRLPETPVQPAPATVAKPELTRSPKSAPAADFVMAMPVEIAKPAAKPVLPAPVIATSAPPAAIAAKPQPVAPAPRKSEPTVVAIAPLPIPIDAPRPTRAAPALPGLPVSEAPVDAPPAAPPVVREVSSPTPPVAVQTVATEAVVVDQIAAPLPQAQPVASPATPAPVQHGEAPQPPIDTNDPRWIDQMARQIADLADGDGRARFRLNPETLGSMEVTVRHTPDGISVRFEVESESTRTLIAHAEQRLQAEARANGLRIADTQVDLTGQGQRHAREHPIEQPLVAVRAGGTPESTPSAEAAPASARYA